MKLVHVTQHKSVATSNIILWADPYVIVMRQTVDHVDARLKTVCCTIQNHVITHVPSVIMLARYAAQDEHPSTKWNSFVPSGCKRKMGGNALVHATFQENLSLSTAFKADNSTNTKYPSHLEKFSSKRFHMTPRPPY